jgi:hypothetical protein
MKRCPECGVPKPEFLYGGYKICRKCRYKVLYPHTWNKPGLYTKGRGNNISDVRTLQYSDLIRMGTCEIIKKHHADMKNDPERLTTDFIQKIVRIDCNDRDKP